MLYRDFATQEQIDAQYDPMRGRDRAALLADWRERSAATRSRLTVREDVAYGPSLTERLDLFPAQQANAPLHVFFHGGYWRSLSHKEFSFVAERLVEAGINVAVVNYALCPSVPFSELVRQCQASLAWLYRHAGELGADAERITVSGHSAGGHLCGMLMATDWEGVFGLPNDLIKGALAISGLFDLRPFPYSWLQPSLQLTGREVTDYSPLFLPPRVAAPVLLTAGGAEPAEFARQMNAYAEHLRDRGIEVHADLKAGDDHFSILEHYVRPGGDFITAIERLSH
ncbi:alpha/beta hydrolase [Litchfieldella rifensis]|uniref:Alpha/beta hydrolase n=1 Tax=Litchfieldella rifensis TaxID=762643 RepID=A0ABV7LKH7_9GAMM